MDSIPPPDPYKILGVAKDANILEIRSAYRKLVLKCHPDKVEDETLKRAKQDEFHQVQQAYELLSGDFRRSHDEHVKLLELREKLGFRIVFSKTHLIPYRFEHELGTRLPASYERSIPELSTRATVAPKSHENVPDERVRDARKRSTSYEMAGDGDEKQHFEERAKRTLRSYGIQALPRTSVFKEDMQRVRDMKLRLEQLRDEKIEFPSKPISRLPRPEPSPKVYPRSQNSEEVIAPGQDVPSRRFRRGRGARQVVGVNGSDDPNDPVC
jgi:curved DNA-binding protein CbpA